MTKRSRYWNHCQPWLVLALFWGLVACRALPAFFRGSYTTEGGQWLAIMWRISPLEALKTIRPDYCVFGNLVVLQLSEWVNALLHGANIDRAPMIQHHVAVGYVALMFLFIFLLLRRNHGTWAALVVCLGMLLVPDLDHENRIFGEATNLGYFSALVVLFVFYDLWLNPQASVRRLIGYGLLVAFHIATSPMAAIITVAWSGLLAVRLLVQRGFTLGASKKQLLLLLVPLVLFSLFTIIRAQKLGPAAAPTDVALFKKSFIEIVLARQLLYPLITNFFLSFTNKLTLITFGLLLALIVAYALAEWRSERRSWQRLTATLVVFAAAFGMAAATAYTRQWIYAHEAHYASLWPARYYIAQNMAMAGFLGLLLLRCTELKPHLRTLTLMFFCVMGTNYAIQQSEDTGRYLAQDDPHVVARWWPYQFRRLHALESLVGDGAEALKQPAKKPFYKVEINIVDHFMEMSPERMEKAVAAPLSLLTDVVPVGFADAAGMKAGDKDYSRSFKVQELRFIPRTEGTLVTFDLALDGLPLFDIKRRKLWLGKVPGEVRALAFGYEMARADRTLSERRSGRRPQNRLFKACLFFKGSHTPDELRQGLTSLRCALGEAPDKYLAATTVLDPLEQPALSALPGDELMALRLHPLKTLFSWSEPAKKMSLVNCAAKDDLVTLKAPTPDDFNEEAYLAYNPDVADAVNKHAVASGKAYYETLGQGEARQICRFTATLPVKAAVSTKDITGIWVQLAHEVNPPSTLSCVLHGDAGQTTTVRLRPAEGEAQHATYFLPAGWAAPHAVHRLELQFEGITGGSHAFDIDEVKLFGQ